MRQDGVAQQWDRLVRGVAEIIDEDALKKKIRRSLETNSPLRVKAGFDPTSPDLHLGHAVLLEKLRDFQDCGHEVDLVVGDFTARIGDPTGRDRLRPRLDPDTVQRNAATYVQQVSKILLPERMRVVFNSTWLAALTSEQILELAAHLTVAQLLARADFRKRYEEGREISLLEFFYPLLQGYDSVHLRSDVELGGTDQKFNLLMGRQLQEVHGQEPQVVMMTPLLVGTDGVKKMSKSLGNAIGLTDPPDEMFGKIMSLDDQTMLVYYEVLTRDDLHEIKRLHPRDAKMRLAETIVSRYWSQEEAARARARFERVFSQKGLPDEMPEYVFSSTETWLDVLTGSGMVPSRSEARRLMRQGAVSCEGSKIRDEHEPLTEGVVRVGKRKFVRLKRAALRQ